MRQYFAFLLLLCGIACLGATYAGEVYREQAKRLGDDPRPRPAPQMMAPRPEATQGSRVSYALIDSAYVGKGW